MNPIKKNPLGRGLDSLIPRAQNANPDKAEKFTEIDITDIMPNDRQPRRDFDPEAMEALTYSIKSKGIMQPLVVSKKETGYMLISGERRLRAAGLGGLKKVPVIIVDMPEENDRLELALIENTQRDDLKPLELADAYKELMDKGGYIQEDVAKIAGKSRSAVANTLRLLDLAEIVRQALEKRKITEGHARVFLTLPHEHIQKLLNMVINKKLSVRQTEALAKTLTAGERPVVEEDADFRALVKEMEEYIGSRVKIKKGKKDTGTVEIKYTSGEELDKIVNKLRGE